MLNLYLVEPGYKLNLSNGRFLIKFKGEVIESVPAKTVKKIVAATSVNISAGIIKFCLQQNIALSWISGSGFWRGGIFNKAAYDIVKQVKQYELRSEFARSMHLAKAVVKSKIHNQRIILRRYRRYNPAIFPEQTERQIKIYKKKAAEVKSKAELMGTEGMAARLYFRELAKLIEPQYDFRHREKRFASNPVNALFNFGYTLLFNEIFLEVMQNGLNPYLGFYHSIKRKHPALVSDLMENFRGIIIDNLVVDFCKRKKLDHGFYQDEAGRCRLKGNLIKEFIAKFEDRLSTVHGYNGKEETYAESIRQAVTDYYSYISGSNEEFRALRIR